MTDKKPPWLAHLAPTPLPKGAQSSKAAIPAAVVQRALRMTDDIVTLGIQASKGPVVLAAC